MTTPALRGEVIEPAHVSQPHSFAAHDFFNLLRDFAHRIGFHNESEVLAALNVIDGYEKHVVPQSDQQHVASEADRSPVEDVSQRKAAQSGLPAAASAPGQPIDYARLAAAIVAAQRSQASDQAAPPVHVVTDVPAPAPAPDPTAPSTGDPQPVTQ